MNGIFLIGMTSKHQGECEYKYII